MYLRECLIENVGPITALDVSLSLNSEGNPKPLILVGKNGTGKTIFLAYILDALAEFAKKNFRDIVIGQQNLDSPLLKIISGGDIRSGNSYGLSLLEFSDAENKFCYVEKVGQINPQSYAVKLRDRFESVRSWNDHDPVQKIAMGDGTKIEKFFQTGAVCFFPSSRHERPHWLNFAAVEDRPLFGNNQRMNGYLGKPLIVERTGEDNQQWLMDVLLDSLVELDISPTEWIIQGNIQDKILLKTGLRNVELLLGLVLEDENAKIILNYRNSLFARIAIRLSNEVVIPSFSHLSAGQSLLFNLFATIIRYADREDINKSFNLHEIKGIVLIDEIDAHIHTDLQYEVLPKLVKLFPKVQFIITSHAPLFLLGMESEFGADGIQILEMPTGKQITAERFGEFLKSFEFYRQTQSFENIIEAKILSASKPLVLTEGQTDVIYIKTALELLGYPDILNKLEIDEVGKSGKDGTKSGGQSNLDKTKKFLESNHSRFPRRVLLLYDCDTDATDNSVGCVLVRRIPQNPENTKVSKGIENLLPSKLFEEKFYRKTTKSTEYGEENIITKFDKQGFCKWICQQKRDKNDFLQFEKLLLPILQDFLSTETV